MGSQEQIHGVKSKNVSSLGPDRAAGWLGGIVQLLAGLMLKAVRAHDRVSWKAGHAHGVNEAKFVLQFPPAEVATPGVDTNLFENFVFPISKMLANTIKADVEKLLPEHQQPTPVQWEMILSTAPSTCIVAGAGSGKSTTMVLRLLVIHYYLGVPLNKITVVTFTRDSRFDFIKKLQKVFSEWKIKISQEEGMAVVRTFHSRILDFFKWSPTFVGVKPFEFLSEKADGDDDEEPENLLNIKLHARQLALMNQCFAKLYGSNRQFRDLIIELATHQISIGEDLNPNDPEHQKRIASIRHISKRDEEVCNIVGGLWRKSGSWPIPGVDASLTGVSLGGHRFYADGYIKELDTYVVLGLDAREQAKEIKLESEDRPLSQAVSLRKIFFQLYFKGKVLYLTNYEQSKATLEVLLGRVSSGPGFSYKVKGEIAAAPLMQAFHSTASFLENLGLDVPGSVSKMRFSLTDVDKKFFMALAIYWPAFERFLSDQTPKVMTFNSMFALFSRASEENFSKVPLNALMAQTVTLVDEFQDCGANTISWLQGVFSELKNRRAALHTSYGKVFPSLMAVGDDWQSIYGWRGSSPKFFQKFQKYFPSPRTRHLLLKDNFRSQQMIIDAAESIVKTARTSPESPKDKTGIAAHPDMKNVLNPVQLWKRDDDRLLEMVERHYSQGHEIMVLTRSRSTKGALTTKLSGMLNRAKRDKKPDNIRLMTYHGSKGLEADVVFLVGDCEQLTLSDYRNQAYVQADLSMNGEALAYDDAQGDEVMRLAYVAITRAKLYCYWFMEENAAGGNGLPKASERVDTSRPFFEDFRQ
ncbi:UvrD-helicase domain-containing protein [Pseudomonas fluorescens]|uniref:UvrD-helicase domain-containing protein n=1 Tax=Pseudomonas fluorescens TaxID=294 RepID=UPI0017803953|nr:UvrD-helicase domain-containing protein [Pseudomonas fluorescens]MBD8775534.1 UvrD-helicase domain-containing protein [Pseudomonas fluorescens]MBD8782068.1 UvrD-helicase domain-containing protein [Pseudomonas fluorescens]MBD8794720.1 UvrD-helicase domain-containing protein [Pseudomonas fluorescens]